MISIPFSFSPRFAKVSETAHFFGIFSSVPRLWRADSAKVAAGETVLRGIAQGLMERAAPASEAAASAPRAPSPAAGAAGAEAGAAPAAVSSLVLAALGAALLAASLRCGQDSKEVTGQCGMRSGSGSKRCERSNGGAYQLAKIEVG